MIEVDQMHRYRNLNGDSGVAFFFIGTDFLKVKFKDGKGYIYTYRSAGSHNIEQMKQLAIRGSGLCSFINRNVRKGYASKF